MCRKNSNPFNGQRAFTLLEMVIALTLLGIGLVGMIQLFPIGLRSSVRAESSTRAAILAQEIMEALKTDDVDLPYIPGDPQLYGIPGNGFDDDRRGDPSTNPGLAAAVDFNRNGRIDVDWDGGYVDRLKLNDQGQWVPGSDGYRDLLLPPVDRFGAIKGDANQDGDPFYDPESTGSLGADEEYADGRDNDGDGRIDEDCMLATNFYMGNSGIPDPLAPGNGWDDDGDGEPGSPTRYVWVETDADPGNSLQRIEVKIKDGNDNNGDGRIDEGIDEEIYDGRDNDNDGMVDEDCIMAAFPFVPVPFPPLVQAVEGFQQERFGHPNERFSWQIFVGRVSDGSSDGLDNDGDGLIDEDPRDGIDNDRDGSIDEDPASMPLPGYRKVVVRITWGGDREDNDGDGLVDEEMENGLDDDGDGNIDEDNYEFLYDLVGFVQIKAQEI